ncbi:MULTISPECIES: HAD family phosphatase [Asticcacaulis]|uniref:HAD family hydrolase n=1 Tax=Asticcacaulis TaxID=76890 RepID=UPI001AE4CA45|nr:MULTISPECIES: HAD family phosphatase [Asticcacaulis]MBP2161617.1 HAD superfamily hydrolase (TIGR01509 family) [Asticcacaulis solisilvae]MDR6802662.1 HAD superfamily hydrolase (TIGR01509 family) [Asticcacaulis sp. BE141]
MPDLKALLFDLDGTLSDTDPVHFEAMKATFAEEGIGLTEHDFRIHISGHSNADIFARYFPHMPLVQQRAFADAKEAAFRRLATTLAPTPGLDRLLSWADARGLKVGLVTNAPSLNVDHMLGALGLTSRFDTIVYGELLPRAKPDPLPYLEALSRLNCRAAEAIAFEDSVPGVIAAKGAGLYVVGLLSAQSRDVLEAAGADMAVTDFSDAALWRRLR